MKKMTRASLAAATTLMLTALLAACGGGGGGGGSVPSTGGVGGNGGGGSTPTPVPSTPTPVPSTPAPTPTPGGMGQLNIASQPLANATVVFTCGCTGDGGKISTDANGNYTIATKAPSVSGNGTYTPNGNNLMIVGYSPMSHTQTWTMLFLGATPAHNLNLSGTPSNANGNVSDTASTAAALYVYYASAKLSGNDRTFDWFNFNTIQKFAQHLRTGPNSGAETQLMSDVGAQQQLGNSLFPGSVLPTWNAVAGDSTNSTITTDLKSVQMLGVAGDPTLPTPCPAVNGCSGAPTP